MYQPHQIAEWFEKPLEELPEEVKEAFKLIKKTIQIPKTSQEEAFASINSAYQKLALEQNY